MSLLDNDIDVSLTPLQLIIHQTIKFFKEYGPFGFGIDDNTLVFPGDLLNGINLEDLIENPKEYLLCYDILWNNLTPKYSRAYDIKIFKRNSIDSGYHTIATYDNNNVSVTMEDVLR